MNGLTVRVYPPRRPARVTTRLIGRPRQCHVEQSALLGLRGDGGGRLVWHQAALHAGHDHRVPLAALRSVEGQQVDAIGRCILERVRGGDPGSKSGAVAERLFAEELENGCSDSTLGVDIG